jgi:squalene-hopene/tetraprenyl-beta-curcumene cyclase
MSVAAGTTLDRALDAGVERLLALQKPGGWWVGELESNVTMTAQHAFVLHFLGRLDDHTLRRVANELLARQRSDGTWAIYWGGDPNLDATIESYAALRLAGLGADDPRLLRTREFILACGGTGAARVFTRIWLALLGLWRWEEIQLVPPEIVLLPPSSPLSVYSFACWARQTMVALSIVMAYRPTRPVPPERACHELDLGPQPRPRTAWDALDRAVARYNGRPFRPLRERALAAAERWLLDRQEVDGSWGGIQPPWVWSLVALVCRGHGPDSPYLRRGVDGWKRFLVQDEDRVRPEACQSPVWDTALAALALATAGARDDSALERAAEWMLDEEIRARGDWAVRRPGLAPAGWAFEYDNDLYPDIDDTAVLALGLHELGAGAPALARACEWLAGMQSSNGGWGAFDVDNTGEWLLNIPFFDFGAVIDPPTADVTAHVVELLARFPAHEPAVRRGVAFLLGEQEADGSWFGRWGVNHVYGTGAALPALAAAGIPHEHPAMRRAVAWLASVQNADGGFGEDPRSYEHGEEGLRWRGQGISTPSQTAWGLIALVAAGEARGETARRAIEWLVQAQRADGDWDEEPFTGTGFPRDFLIRYHLYRIVWPVLALARARRALAGA